MPKTTALHNTSAPAGAHLTYYGGKVISNVQVTQVLYGSGTYTSEVTDTSTTDGTSIASFYTGVTNSTYFDWLSEYNTTINAANGQPGTQQTVGRGSFVRQVQITPAAGNNGNTVDDTNIQAELKSQISKGVLPAPTANTLYAVHFRANQTITQGGSSSGVAFCAYHGTVGASGTTPEFYYSVLPDFTTGGMTSGYRLQRIIQPLIPKYIRGRANQPSNIVFRPDSDAQIGRGARLVEMPNQHRPFAQRRRQLRPAARQDAWRTRNSRWTAERRTQAWSAPASSPPGRRPPWRSSRGSRLRRAPKPPHPPGRHDPADRS